MGEKSHQPRQQTAMLINREKYKCCGYQIPQYLFFVLSGAICDVVQACIDYAISLVYIYDWEKPTICWTLSYTISILVRHFSHKQLVFGDYEGTYCSSLARTYMTYSSSIVISLITNHLITTYFMISHAKAWILTMLWTGLYNYFMLKATWKRKSSQPTISSNSKKVPN